MTFSSKKLQDIPDNKKPLETRGVNSTYSIWLKQKQQRDCQIWKGEKQLWIIQNKMYDLSQFASKHPGGSHWLTYTQGHNITEHYMTHHLNLESTNKILQKYYVRDCQKMNPQQKDRFTFQDQGLFMQVKKRMLQKYTIDELKDTRYTKKIGIIFFTLWLITLILAGVFQSYFFALLCGYLMIPVTGIAHNFVHKKPSFFKYFYLVTGFIPKEWQIMHCLSHHEYANTLLDYQLQAFEPIVYFLRITPKNNFMRVIIAQLIYILVIPTNFVLKLLVVPITKRQYPEWQYCTALLQLVLLYGITDDFTISLKLFFTIHCFFGFIFAKVTFGSHRTQRIWTEGCEEVKQYGLHSLYTSNDIYPELKNGFLSYLIMSGFNIHVVHHLFPTIDNAQLYKVDQILKQVCNERSLNKCQITLPYAIKSKVMDKKQ